MHQVLGLYNKIEADMNDSLQQVSTMSWIRNKKSAFLQKINGRKLAIYTNKADSIAKEFLHAKTLSIPIDVLLTTIMRAANKDVLKNGPKALACAKDSERDYKN